MSVAFDSLVAVKTAVQGYIRTQLPSWGQAPTQFLGKVAAVCTLAVYGLLKTARQIDRDAIPNSQTSTQGLDDWGTGLGLPRKEAEPATGGAGTFTGAPGTLYPALTTLTASDGVTQFELAGNVLIPGGGSASGVIVATTAGAVGNLPVGSVLTVDTVPAGGAANVTLTTGLTGGIDRETNAAFLVRIQARLANPPKAVTGPDLRGFAEGTVLGDAPAPKLPAARAYVYPLRSGTGTADVVLTQTGDGTGSTRAAVALCVTAVDTTLQADRTVTADINTMAPHVAATGLAVIARATPSASKYNFDWNSYGAGLTVSAYNAGVPSLTLNAAPPASFTDAVTAELRPRLQINPTGAASPLPQEVQVVSYNAGTKVCTLAEAFDDAPQVGDVVNAGGPVVAGCAVAVRDLCNGLGPSTASGYADPNDAEGWDDTLRLDQIRRVVLNVADTDGVRMVLALAAAPTINGVAADLRAADATPGQAPELLYLKSISIVP